MGIRLKWIFSLLGLFSVILISVFLFSSCGFLSSVGSGASVQESQDTGPGDGDTPSLASRIKDNPEIEDRECKDSDTCEEVCENIYKDSDSSRDCIKLTIGKVAPLEEVFYALLEAKYAVSSGEREEDDLGNIEDDDLENYLEIGLDGWRDKVIEKQIKTDNRNERFKNALSWIVDEENDVVPILKREDRSNEILKEIFLGHCNIGDTNTCQNFPGDLGSLTEVGSVLRFDYALGELIYNFSMKIATIDDRENKELFLALVAGGGDFFERAAKNRRFNAFALGNDLLERACTSRNSISLHQCIAAFYCYLGEQTDSSIARDFFEQGGMIEAIGRTIDLKGCFGNDSTFEAI